MSKINLLNFIKEDWYINLNKEFLNYLIEESKEKIGSQSGLSRYLKVNESTISRWLGKVKNKNTKPTYKNIKLLAELNNINNIERKIIGIKCNNELNFLNLTSLDLSPKLVRSIFFIMGDGSIDKNRIRFANSNKLAVKNVLVDLSNIFNLKKSWISLTFPKNSKEIEVENLVKNWETYLGYKINSIYKKHDTKIRGQSFNSKKEYV